MKLVRFCFNRLMYTKLSIGVGTTSLVIPKLKSLKPTRMQKKKHGKPKSDNCSKHHPPQHPAPPAIDPSRIAGLSDTHNYLRTAKAMHKVSPYAYFELVVFALSVLRLPHLQQQEEELRLIHQRIADLQIKLRDCRAEIANLLNIKANDMQRLEKAKRIERGLDRQIHVSHMTCVSVCFDINVLEAG